MYIAPGCSEQPANDLHLLQTSSGFVWQSRDLKLSCNHCPHLCFFIVLKCNLFVYRDDSLTS